MELKINFSDEVIEKLCEKIGKFSPEEIYKFDVSDKDVNELNQILGDDTISLESCGKSPYERTFAVRGLLAEPKWWEDRTQVERIARWIATNWGRVDRRASDNAELNLLIDKADSNHLAGTMFDIKRIATWSKYIAFRHPEERAIYDARTAFSLNWLIYESGGKKFFPFLTGENTLLSALDYRLWLATKTLGPDSILASLKKEINGNLKKSRTVGQSIKEISINPNYAYGVYCELLKRVANKLYPGDPWGLTKVEMVLFSIASTSIALDVYKTVVVNVH